MPNYHLQTSWQQDFLELLHTMIENEDSTVIVDGDLWVYITLEEVGEVLGITKPSAFTMVRKLRANKKIAIRRIARGKHTRVTQNHYRLLRS